MAGLQIDEVVVASSDGAGHGSIESPTAGDSLDAVGFTVSGWTFGIDVPVSAVEIMARGEVLRRTALSLARTDVAELFPGLEGAKKSGFTAGVGMIGLPSPFELEVYVVAGDQRWRWASISGRRGAASLRLRAAPTAAHGHLSRPHRHDAPDAIALRAPRRRRPPGGTRSRRGRRRTGCTS